METHSILNGEYAMNETFFCVWLFMQGLSPLCPGGICMGE